MDEGQYFYLDKRHYNLLGGTSYLLGHPCYPLWSGYMRVVRDNPLTAHKDGTLSNEIVTFAVWDESTARWLHAKILSGLPQWNSHRAQIRVDINAIPEPSSVGLIGLGALGFLALRDTRKNERTA